jgi:hypothetical protein
MRSSGKRRKTIANHADRLQRTDQKLVLPRLAAAGAEVGVTYGLAHALAWLEERGLLSGTVE